MAVTVVTRKSEGKPAANGKPAKPAFEYKKIITPATKRGGKEEAATASYPTFTEFAQFMNGKVEIELDKDGSPVGDSVLSLAIEGWNLASNRNAAFAAGNTIESTISKMDELIKDIAKKFGKSEADVRAMLIK